MGTCGVLGGWVTDSETAKWEGGFGDPGSFEEELEVEVFQLLYSKPNGEWASCATTRNPGGEGRKSKVPVIGVSPCQAC